MRLCDRIKSWDGREPVPPNTDPTPLKQALDQAMTRYILADEVTALARRWALTETANLARVLDIVRVPSTPVWIEWDDAGRHDLLVALGMLGKGESEHHRRVEKCGLLLEHDGNGRRGRARIAWFRKASIGEVPQGPQMCPIEILFDLDDARFPEGLPPDNFFQVNIQGVEDPVGPFKVERVIDGRLPGFATDQLLWRQKIRTYLDDTIGELQHALAFFALLQARNKAVQLVPSQLTQLNKARRKGGRPELLDHIEVRMSLSRVQERRVAAAVSAEEQARRKSPRFHYVSGHVVRRGDLIFWRSAHTRGDVKRRTVQRRTITVVP